MLAIRVLGELAVLRDGKPLALPPSRKTRALLGYLVANAIEPSSIGIGTMNLSHVVGRDLDDRSPVSRGRQGARTLYL